MTELLVLNVGKHELQAVSLDGSRVRTLISGLDELPDGIVVDQRLRHVYWTNMGAPDPGSAAPGDMAYSPNGSLERADLDGGNRVTVVPRGAFTTACLAAPQVGMDASTEAFSARMSMLERHGSQSRPRGESDTRRGSQHSIGVTADGQCTEAEVSTGVRRRSHAGPPVPFGHQQQPGGVASSGRL